MQSKDANLGPSQDLALRWAGSARLLGGAIAVTAFFSLGAPSSASPAARGMPLRVENAGPAPLGPATCPPASLPDGDACVRLPDDEDGAGSPEVESSVNTHRDSFGHWVVYDEIPRRPERPADYGAYRYPVPCEPDNEGPSGRACGGACVVSGFDLDRPDAFQRRGRLLRQVGQGAVVLLV